MVISTANTRPKSSKGASCSRNPGCHTTRSARSPTPTATTVNTSDPTCHGRGREVVSRAARMSSRKNRTSRLAARRVSGSTEGGGSVRRSGRLGVRRVFGGGPPRSPLGGGAYGLSTPVSLPPVRWPRPAAANRAGSVACVPPSSSVPGAPGWAAPTPPSPAVLPAKARVVVLISGTGTNLAALLAAHRDPAYGARVVGVVSDRAGVPGLAVAREAGVPTVVVAPADFPDRARWDAGLAQAVAVFDPALVVSAGFMRILGTGFLDRFGGRVINTHPALLPAFPGAHAVRDALAHGVKVTGCTVHVVDAGVDTGPIIAQRAVQVTDGDDEARLHERIKDVERDLLVEVVGRVARDGLTVHGRTARLGEPDPGAAPR